MIKLLNIALLVSLLLFLSVSGCNRIAPIQNSKKPHIEDAADAIKVSRFGEYSGYSERKFNSFVRRSRYVPVRDGTRLAVDTYHPAINGREVTGKFPVIFTMERYWRAAIAEDGSLMHKLSHDDMRRYLLEHGYVIAVADLRGTGASFGRHPGSFSVKQSEDSYDLIEWSAKQPWSTGKVGMVGISYGGMTQFTAAAQKPPSLQAIFPMSAGFDANGEAFSSGGVLRKAAVGWGSAVDWLDGLLDEGETLEQLQNPESILIAPVQGEDGLQLLLEARQDHRKPNPAVPSVGYAGKLDELAATGKFYRDSTGIADGPPAPYIGHADPQDHLLEINRSGIPVYYWGGWYDVYAGEPLLWFKNLQGPKKIVAGPWTHEWNEENDPREDASRVMHAIEALRWYDFWLKGIDNGVMDEPVFRYAIIGEGSDQWAWQTTDRWPANGVKRRDFHFGSTSGALKLSTAKPEQNRRDSFTVDYTASTGKRTRFYDSMSDDSPIHYPEMSEINSKGLVYTSDVLRQDTVLLGYPVVTLDVTSTAADGEFNVYLQKVTADGQSLFVTEGVMLASRRSLAQPPYDNLGMPYTDNRKAVVEATLPLSRTETRRLSFYLQPVGILFERGSKIRVAITGADADNSFQIVKTPAPVHSVHSGTRYESKISLPLLDNGDELGFIQWSDAPLLRKGLQGQ